MHKIILLMLMIWTCSIHAQNVPRGDQSPPVQITQPTRSISQLGFQRTNAQDATLQGGNAWAGTEERLRLADVAPPPCSVYPNAPGCYQGFIDDRPQPSPPVTPAPATNWRDFTRQEGECSDPPTCAPENEIWLYIHEQPNDGAEPVCYVLGRYYGVSPAPVFPTLAELQLSEFGSCPYLNPYSWWNSPPAGGW